jgi:predicted secreted Zn-dependent protease
MRLFRNGYIKLVIAGALLLGTAGTYALSARQDMTIKAVASTAAALSQKSDNPASSAGASTPSASAKSNKAPSCQRGNYASPAAPLAVTSDPGLHANVLAPAYYTVYGNNVNEINGQMAHCTPVSDGDGSYAASTDYALNWAFDYQGGSDGLCHVTAASVAINIAVVYPSWQPSSGAAAGLSKSWQRFSTNLATHENGHVKYDQAGAAQLLANIQNFPATNCDTIIAQVTNMANNTIGAMNQTNDNYDASTNHGETQGAVLN